jgi:UPF0042 nucleotide-binding protein
MKTSLIIVTGMSGSGKTTALKTLEDLGCEVMDNVPLSLCQALILEKNPKSALALGIDIRTRGFNPKDFSKTLANLRTPAQVTVLFFDAENATLESRYRETRRQHPMGMASSTAMLIEQERIFLEPLIESTDQHINTSRLSPPELKSYLQNTLLLESKGKTTVYCMSFAYRHGIPRSADFVFDMRFLPNPYYEASMKLLTGKSPEVQSFFAAQPAFQQFTHQFFPLLDMVLSGGRTAFVLAFGCSGGRHRSVCTAEKTLSYLESRHFIGHIYHRDMT